MCSIGLLLVVGDPGNQIHLSLLLVWLCIPPAIMAVRQAVRRLLASLDLLQVRTLVASDPAHIAEVSKALSADASLGYRHVGSIGLDTLAAVGVRAALEHANAEFLVLAQDGGTDLSLQTINAELARQGVPFAVALTQSAGAPVVCPQSHYALNCNLMLVACGNRLNHLTARLSKAIFDVLLASVMLVLMAPVLGVITLLVRADGGPAFYAHTRVGANGRRFACLKFRTMAIDADTILQRVLAADPAAAAEWQANRKLANDPRITA